MRLILALGLLADWGEKKKEPNQRVSVPQMFVESPVWVRYGL